jgi:four helix bundle protein
MSIKCFEDLIAWQEARKLTKIIYEITATPIFNKDPDLKRHLRRTAVSIMANIAEGFGRYSLKESKQFFTDARGSNAELQSHMYVVLDQSYITENKFNEIYQQSVLVNKLINGLITNTRKLIDSNTREFTNSRTQELKN